MNDILSGGSAEASGNCTIIYNPTKVNTTLYAEYKQNRDEIVEQSIIDKANMRLSGEVTNIQLAPKTLGRN